MNKKYLILKNKVPKAEWGLLTGSTQKDYRDKLFIKKYGVDAFNTTSEADIDNVGSGLAEKSSANTAGIIGTTASVVGAGADLLYNNALDKNIETTGFGNQLIDKKDAKIMTAQSATQGLTKGAATGAAIGSIIPGWGTAVGAVVGGLIGGVTGLLKGKKQSKDAMEQSQKQLDVDVSNQTQMFDRQLSQGLMNMTGQRRKQSQSLTGKEGRKLEVGHFNVPKLGNKSLMMKSGGKLEEPGAVNVVLKGAMHRENNNLGNKDKGIPVVDADGKKEYEVEEGEIIFRKELTDKVEDYAKRYEETKDESLLEELGKMIAKELMTNTQDNYGKFGVKIKENAN